jgi:hypothetical protein
VSYREREGECCCGSSDFAGFLQINPA